MEIRMLNEYNILKMLDVIPDIVISKTLADRVLDVCGMNADSIIKCFIDACESFKATGCDVNNISIMMYNKKMLIFFCDVHEIHRRFVDAVSALLATTLKIPCPPSPSDVSST